MNSLSGWDSGCTLMDWRNKTGRPHPRNWIPGKSRPKPSNPKRGKPGPHGLAGLETTGINPLEPLYPHGKPESLTGLLEQPRKVKVSVRKESPMSYKTTVSTLLIGITLAIAANWTIKHFE